MIEIKNLSKRYPKNTEYTLSDINVTFPDRGLIYIIGKSGSGKSTLLNLLGAIDTEYEGSIRVNGEEIREKTDDALADYRFSTISFMFQSYRADDNETVEETLHQFLLITDYTESEKNQVIQEALDKVGLGNRRKSLFKELSGGEKKRVSLARALIKESSILLADEPLSSLNKGMRAEVTKTLKEESRSRLVIVITHETDEIPEDATIYQLKDKRLILVRRGKTSSGYRTKQDYSRIDFSFLSFLRLALMTLKSKRGFLSLALLTLSIGLFSITFSFQLSSNVSESLIESMSDYMKDNTLVISNKQDGLIGTGFLDPEPSFIRYLVNEYPDYVIGEGGFYLTQLDSVFKENQSVSISNGNRKMNINKLSADSFLEFSTFEERNLEDIKLSLNDDEVYLSLDDESLGILFSLMDVDSHGFDDEAMSVLKEKLIRTETKIDLSCFIPDISYSSKLSFLIKGIVHGENAIIHSDSLFSDSFIGKLGFRSISMNEQYDPTYPLTLRRISGIRVKEDKISSFFKVFVNDIRCDPYVMDIVTQEERYDHNDPKTHNHIALYQDCMSKISLPKISSFMKDNKSLIQSVSFSSSIYTYTASGYISGFAKPFFFSKYKEKLNLIQDNSMFSDSDLGALQGSLIEDVDGVIKADLLSSMNSDGLRFVTLDGANRELISGRKPADFTQIGISRGMAISLFGSVKDAVGSELYTLTLDETIAKEDKYENIFSEGSLVISGVYDDEEVALFHESLFPLAYSFEHTYMSMDSMRVNQAVIEVDLNLHDADYYLDEVSQIDEDYIGSFPMLNMSMEIKSMMKRLSFLFLGFSVLSLISASFLLSMAMYLIIRKDSKQIGIMLSMGFRKKEISGFYFRFTLLIGILAYFLSLILSLITESSLGKAINSMLSVYSFSIYPFFISFGISMLLTVAIGFLMKRRIISICPIDAFVK